MGGTLQVDGTYVEFFAISIAEDDEVHLNTKSGLHGDSKLGKRCVDSYDYDFGNRHGALQGSNSETITSEHSHSMRK